MNLPFSVGLRFVVAALICATVPAEEHDHHTSGLAEPVKPPKIFLDKSLRIVQYQLNRLDNERLLLVERKTDDAKYAPVYSAIVTRAGMSPQYREEALAGLVELNKSDAATELLTALETINPDDRQQQRTGRQLAALLLRQPRSLLTNQTDALREATQSDNRMLRSTGYAGLVTAGQGAAAWSAAKSKPSATLDWLAAVSLIPKPRLRASLRDQVATLIDASYPMNVRRAAVLAIASVPAEQDETFSLVAPLASDAKLRDAAVATMLKIPTEHRDPDASRKLIDFLVKHAEATPAADRTSDRFIDAMQLADQLLARLPVEQARSYRGRLRDITVRVVRIKTVEEEMRYDLPYFVVEASRPVQVILQNEDLMPHNLVLTVPDALKEVAQLGLSEGPNGHQGRQYVPDSDKVLHATDMVQPHRQARLTFTAPSEPGEYPYVCTFPRHWMRMYGVMVVVEDLDAWLKNPIKPKDPIGSNRSFVQAWTLDDFTADLDTGLRSRSPEIGHRLLTEATCVQCHKVKGQGGTVGPKLTEAFKRWKGDRLAVLREILEPSHRIDPKYAVHVIYTADGKVVTGIVTAEDKQSVSVLDNPEALKPTVIQRGDIDEMLKTSKSMMPKALLDRFSKDEVFEILAFLESLGAQ
ncbi:MAG: hypothetical protein CMJ64_21610 [Planctomycetaceae bacterium]|nr:hypothetical protein [Planctomycetaceae bacterium]